MRERNLFNLFALFALFFFNGSSANKTVLRGNDQRDIEESNNVNNRADDSVRSVGSFDYLSLLTRKRFQIKCCRGGLPQIIHPYLVSNFTYNVGKYLTDNAEDMVHESSDNSAETSPDSAPAGALNCRMYYGMYFTLINFDLNTIQVICKCPDIGSGHQLDHNCRRLPMCKNGGVYMGEECRGMLCMNGGREENGRCICAPQFLGYNCEIDTNRTRANGSGASHFHTAIDLSTRTGAGDSTRFQRLGDHVSNEMFTRDISGTIFSLIMIIILVVSMYLLMKHRMQARYLSRRPDLVNACNFPVAPTFGGAIPTGMLSTARRVELMPTFDEATSGTAGEPTSARTFPFRSFVESLANTFIPGDGGPPPYIAPGQRGRRNPDEVLPPLPSYEDATKLPPLRQNVGAERDAPTECSGEMLTQALDVRAPTVAERGTNENYSSSVVPETEAIRTCRQRPSSYMAPYAENAENLVNVSVQEENRNIADDDECKSLTICNTVNSQQHNDTTNQIHQNTMTTTNNTVKNDNIGASVRHIIDENNRRNSGNSTTTMTTSTRTFSRK